MILSMALSSNKYIFNNMNKKEAPMKKNVGGFDRGIRIALGLVLIAVAIFVPGSKWGYIGILPLFTGLLGWCPPYSLIGFSSNKCCDKDKK